MLEKIAYIMQNNDMSVPRTLLLNYKDLKLEEKQLIFLIYLLNEKDMEFNPETISSDLKISLEEVLETISDLSSKDLLEITMKKENNIHHEYLDLSKLFRKLSLLYISEETEKEEDNSNSLFVSFEKEFGRTLTPNEAMIINRMNDEYGEELITCALNEAIYNGVKTLRYIDSILSDWQQKGIKNQKDVENSKKNFQRRKNEKKQLFDYDYLNED